MRCAPCFDVDTGVQTSGNTSAKSDSVFQFATSMATTSGSNVQPCRLGIKQNFCHGTGADHADTETILT